MRLADDRLLTSKQAAAVLQRCTRTLRRYVKAGRLTPVRLGHIPFYRESELCRALGIPPESVGE